MHKNPKGLGQDIFHRFGIRVIIFIHSYALVFRFLGHLIHSVIDLICGKVSIVWANTVEFIYYSGARIVILLSFICTLLGISISQTVYWLLNPFRLHQKALPIVQNIITHQVLPILIAFILCIQAALHLINTRERSMHQDHNETMLAHVWPIIIGTNISALLLYVYLAASIFLSFYITFHSILNFTTNEFLIYITNATTFYDLIYSLFKTLILCVIVGFSASYYYYEAASRHIFLRKAVSRILTRTSFWLIMTSMYITFVLRG